MNGLFQCVNSPIHPWLFSGVGIMANLGYTQRAPGDFSTLWTSTGAIPSSSIKTIKIKLIISGTDWVITAVAGTTYSINGGTATAEAGVINDGDVLQAFDTNSSLYSTERIGGVVINGVACAISSTTKEDVIAFGPTWEEPGVWNNTLTWAE